MTATTDTGVPGVRFDELTVRFGETTALADVSGSVHAGEWVALVGANGAGKSTMLRALAHLERHDGTVRIAGRDMAGLPYRKRAQLVAYVPQKPELPPTMSVMQYTLLGRTPHLGYFAGESENDHRRCAQLLERLGLVPFAGRALGTLSGGELQRVVLARALAQEATLLLLDEPTSALDLGRRVEVLELVDELRGEHELTVVSALHDLTLAAEFADRLLLLAGGRLVAYGPPTAVLRESVLSQHLGAPVRVLQTPDGGIAVVPPRRGLVKRASSNGSHGPVIKEDGARA